MKNFLRGVLKAMTKILIVSLVTLLVIVLISKIWGYEIKNLCMIFGVVYMFLGIGSVMGNMKMTSNARYNFVRASSTDNFSNSIKQDFFSREKSEKFLVYVAVIGFILVLVAGLFK